MNGLHNLLGAAALKQRGRSRAINAENPTGEKGAGGQAASALGPGRKGRPCLTNIHPGETVTLADIEGPGMVRHVWATVDLMTTPAEPFVLRDLVLRIYWDGEETPSVEAPLGDFFCCGFGRAALVNSLPIVVAPARGLNAYFQMPFERRARVTLESQHPNPIPAFFYQIDYTLLDVLPEGALRFHTQWRRERETELGRDYVILDGVRGAGQYVGTYVALATLERYWWGEGELKFYLDGDVEHPTICGTGMEDYFGGAWSFASQADGKTLENTYCTPFLGYPFYSKTDGLVHNPYHNDDCPPMRGFYRWHLADPILFERDFKVTMQQIGVGYGGLFERRDDVSSVAYWYQEEPHEPFPAFPPRAERRPR